MTAWPKIDLKEVLRLNRIARLQRARKRPYRDPLPITEAMRRAAKEEHDRAE